MGNLGAQAVAFYLAVIMVWGRVRDSKHLV